VHLLTDAQYTAAREYVAFMEGHHYPGVTPAMIYAGWRDVCAAMGVYSSGVSFARWLLAEDARIRDRTKAMVGRYEREIADLTKDHGEQLQDLERSQDDAIRILKEQHEEALRRACFPSP
jgi:hypothetical protein